MGGEILRVREREEKGKRETPKYRGVKERKREEKKRKRERK